MHHYTTRGDSTVKTLWSFIRRYPEAAAALALTALFTAWLMAIFSTVFNMAISTTMFTAIGIYVASKAQHNMGGEQ